MLEVTGRSSDGWIWPLNMYVPPAAVLARQQLIDNAARSAGRDPATLRRIYNVIGAIGSFHGGTGLVGDVPLWIDTLPGGRSNWASTTFIFWPATDPLAQVEDVRH
jgi:hypothetical protein